MFHGILKAVAVLVVVLGLAYGWLVIGSMSGQAKADADYKAIQQKRKEDFRKAIVEIDRQSVADSSRVQLE